MCGGMGCGRRDCLSFVSPEAKVLSPHHTHYLIPFLSQTEPLIQREATSLCSPHSLVWATIPYWFLAHILLWSWEG